MRLDARLARHVRLHEHLVADLRGWLQGDQLEDGGGGQLSDLRVHRYAQEADRLLAVDQGDGPRLALLLEALEDVRASIVEARRTTDLLHDDHAQTQPEDHPRGVGERPGDGTAFPGHGGPGFKCRARRASLQMQHVSGGVAGVRCAFAGRMRDPGHPRPRRPGAPARQLCSGQELGERRSWHAS